MDQKHCWKHRMAVKACVPKRNIVPSIDILNTGGKYAPQGSTESYLALLGREEALLIGNNDTI